MKRFLFLLALGFLSACGGGPDLDAPPPAPNFPYIRMAPSAPPDPKIEPRPANPSPMTLEWRRGHWVYDSETFAWEPGRFIDRPTPTAVWAPDRWERRMYGWAFIPGHWE